MSNEIKNFFDQFVEDFPTFDGGIISNRYMTPYTAVSRDGDLWLCASREDLVDYFQSLLDRHSSQGVAKCKYEELETTTLGDKCHKATVTWTMMTASDETVSNWRESYNLIETTDGLKIFTSIDH